MQLNGIISATICHISGPKNFSNRHRSSLAFFFLLFSSVPPSSYTHQWRQQRRWLNVHAIVIVDVFTRKEKNSRLTLQFEDNERVFFRQSIWWWWKRRFSWKLPKLQYAISKKWRKICMHRSGNIVIVCVRKRIQVCRWYVWKRPKRCGVVLVWFVGRVRQFRFHVSSLFFYCFDTCLLFFVVFFLSFSSVCVCDYELQ